MDKLTLLKHLHAEVYCRIMPAGERGVGVFAVRDIPNGVDPFLGSFQGDYVAISAEELESIPEPVRRMVMDYCVSDEKVWWIPQCGLNALDVSFYVNHSTTPNLVTSDGKRFVSSKTILKGEELLVDYRTYTREKRW